MNEAVIGVPCVVAGGPRQLSGEGLAQVVEDPGQEVTVTAGGYDHHYHHAPANPYANE
jgi:hypothetical protein